MLIPCILLHLLAKFVEQIRRYVFLHDAAVDVRQLQRHVSVRPATDAWEEGEITLMNISRKWRILMTSAGISSCFSLVCALWKVTTLRMYLGKGAGRQVWHW
jgi:hypothetical protein